MVNQTPDALPRARGKQLLGRHSLDPLVSIIIPVGNDAEGLAITLDSLARHLAGGIAFEVIVCNDGGGDDVGAVVEQFGCCEARLDRNLGSYAARNAGLALARGVVIAFLDADQRVAPGWLARGIAALEDADYVGGRVVVENPDPSDRWRLYDELTAFDVRRYIEDLHFAPTANLFVRTEIVSALGPFLPQLRSGGDREFGLRVYEAGFRQGYCDDAVTYHDARGKRALLVKRLRTGAGMADVRLQAWKQPWWLVLGYGLAKLATVPLVWALASVTPLRYPGPWGQRLHLAAIEARLAAAFYLAYLQRAFALRHDRS